MCAEQAAALSPGDIPVQGWWSAAKLWVSLPKGPSVRKDHVSSAPTTHRNVLRVGRGGGVLAWQQLWLSAPFGQKLGLHAEGLRGGCISFIPVEPCL